MIVVICGPTGVGKTKLSIDLAKKYNAIIINADSTQVYQDLNIGTAKITEEEKENIPHYLFDIKNINEEYSIYEYQKDVRRIIEENKDKNIIIVGGSGLYIKAALYDYKFQNDNTTNNYENYSNDELFTMVLKKYPNSNVHKNNRIRLIRYLNKKDDVLHKSPLLYKDAIFIGLTTDRENLYKIINKRTDDMINNGLIEEVRQLKNKNKYSKVLNTAIGYKEIIKYLNKEIFLDEAIELIKKNSRHYAKRQYTWFNNQMDVKWFNTNYQNFNETICEVIKYIEANKKN